MNIKLKCFILLSFVFGLSSNTFAVTQNVACFGEEYGDTILRFNVMGQVSYDQNVTEGVMSSISISNVLYFCDEGQYGSTYHPCTRYNPDSGGVYITEPVEFGQSGTMNSPNSSQTATRNFTPTSARNTVDVSPYVPYGENCNYSFPYTVNPSTPQCSDNQPNDSDGLNDEDDPQCHTDCNVNNPNSYAPNHNSETTPPNGTCPVAPTLNLNGRAAFLQVVKNFIAFVTTKTSVFSVNY